MNLSYLTKIALHIGFGFLIYYVFFFPILFFFGVVVYSFYKIFTAAPKDKTIVIITVSAYVVGAEVLFRMTKAGVFYESSKYLVILFMIIGMIYNGLSNRSYPYLIYLFLLVPSVVIASANIGLDANLRKNVAFVLSGPVCLGISALFCYDKRITVRQLYNVVLHLGLPILTLTVYLYLYTVRLEDIFRGTQSNFAASGGFGPNQVSTILGVGMFVFCINFFIRSRSILVQLISIAIFGAVSYRGIVTFSRGGVLTAILMIFAFLVIYYYKSNYKKRRIISVSLMVFLMASVATWVISSTQTSGLIDKRYSNQDARGREKEDISTGRVDIFVGELEIFYEYPFFGIGASGMKEERLKRSGEVLATHNEVSRILSEHGLLGIIMLLILIAVPLSYRLNHKGNLFFYSFLVFWFATINHSAMRIAAPGFIYALALLNISYEKRSLRRKRIIQ